MIRIIRVRKRETIIDPQFVELFKRAVERSRYPIPWPLMFADLARRIDHDGLGVFLAHEKGAPRGLVIAILPDSPLMMAPQVPLVYSESKQPALVRALYRAVTKWLKESGYHSMLSLALRHPPKAWARRFRNLGEFRVVAPLVEVRF